MFTGIVTDQGEVLSVEQEGDLRARIATAWPAPAARRAYWERYVDLAIATPFDPSADATLAGLIEGSGSARPSALVTLVGAGPGDAELLTVKAVRALQAADVILHDELVGAATLDLARREATRLLVGKDCGRPTAHRQPSVPALLLELARAGKRVVRLQSGDAMASGRAGEEIAALRRAGVSVEIVPGIAAGHA